MTPASEVAVRPARESDREDLARLSTQLGYPMSEREARERLAKIAGHPDHALLVAERDGRVAGWLQVSRVRVFESEDGVEIGGLVVDETLRGRGIGAMLLAEAERWARERGCHRIRVRSNVVRERAHAFYRSAGFSEVKTQRVFEKLL
jgi:GNAT superfamily N-acetyltransferase